MSKKKTAVPQQPTVPPKGLKTQKGEVKPHEEWARKLKGHDRNRVK